MLPAIDQTGPEPFSASPRQGWPGSNLGDIRCRHFFSCTNLATWHLYSAVIIITSDKRLQSHSAVPYRTNDHFKKFMEKRPFSLQKWLPNGMGPSQPKQGLAGPCSSELFRATGEGSYSEKGLPTVLRI